MTECGASEVQRSFANKQRMSPETITITPTVAPGKEAIRCCLWPVSMKTLQSVSLLLLLLVRPPGRAAFVDHYCSPRDRRASPAVVIAAWKEDSEAFRSER